MTKSSNKKAKDAPPFEETPESKAPQAPEIPATPKEKEVQPPAPKEEKQPENVTVSKDQLEALMESNKAMMAKIQSLENRETKPPQTSEEEMEKRLEEKVRQMLKVTQQPQSNSSDKLEKVLSNLVKQQQTTPIAAGGGHKLVAALTRDEIDMDDILEEPATFFAYSVRYSVWDDRRSGQYVATPYQKPIFFHPHLRYLKQGTENTRFGKQFISISQAVVHSKREAEFLRDHTLFGIKFHEKIGDAIDIEPDVSEAVTRIAQRTDNMSQLDVINQCKNLGLPMMEDVKVMKRMLVRKLAEKEVEGKKGRPVADAFSSSMDPSTQFDEILSHQGQDGTVNQKEGRELASQQ